MHSTSSAALLLGAYKELFRKALLSQRLDDSSVVVQHANVAHIYNSRAQRLHLSIDRKRAFRRLRQLVQLDLSDLFQAARSSATTARKKVTTVQHHETEAIPKTEMAALYGTNGVVRASILYLLGSASKVFMQLLNTTTVHGTEHLEQALARQPGQALITVSNHVAAADDPLVISSILPSQYFGEPEKLRWTLCATDRCFRSKAMVSFFRSAKVLPVERGSGMHQAGLKAAEAVLQQGDWVHIFPEGTRSKDGSLGPVRKGVGRLIAACEQPPVVLPFVHKGMETIMPRGTMVPKVGQQVEVVVGEPVEVADLLAAARQEGWEEDRLYQALAGRVAVHMRVLRARLEGLELDLGAEGGLGGVELVSGLELYDLAEARASLWERCKFKMQGVVGVGVGAAEALREGVRERLAARGEEGGLAQEGLGFRMGSADTLGWRWREGRLGEYWRMCSDEVMGLLQMPAEAV